MIASSRTATHGAAQAAVVPVLFFDGDCGLCNRLVRVLLRLDMAGRLHYAPLQGAAAQGYLRSHGLPTADFDTILFVPDWSRREGATFLVRTDGIIGALRAIGTRTTRVLAGFIAVFPQSVRDGVYRVIGRWRYRIFGPWKPRPLAQPQWGARFLD